MRFSWFFLRIWFLVFGCYVLTETDKFMSVERPRDVALLLASMRNLAEKSAKPRSAKLGAYTLKRLFAWILTGFVRKNRTEPAPEGQEQPGSLTNS